MPLNTRPQQLISSQAFTSARWVGELIRGCPSLPTLGYISYQEPAFYLWSQEFYTRAQQLTTSHTFFFRSWAYWPRVMTVGPDMVQVHVKTCLMPCQIFHLGLQEIGSISK